MNGVVKIYDISRHEPKILTTPKSCYDMFSNFGEIIMAKSNSNGTQLGITIASESLVPDGKLYVWNLERDLISEFDFLGGNGDEIPNR